MAARFAGSWTGYHARVSPGQTALADLASGRVAGPGRAH